MEIAGRVTTILREADIMTYTGTAPGEFFAAAVNLHDLGVKGDQEAVQKARRMFEEIFGERHGFAGQRPPES